MRTELQETTIKEKYFFFKLVYIIHAFLNKILQGVSYILRIIITFLTGFLLILTLIGIFGRFLGIDTSWVVELSVFTFVIIISLGLMLAQKNRSHLRITAFVEKLSPKKQRITIVFSELFTLVGLIIIANKGYFHAINSLNISTSTLSHYLSVGHFYIFFPLGVFFIALYTFNFMLGILIYPENVMKWLTGE